MTRPEDMSRDELIERVGALEQALGGMCDSLDPLDVALARLRETIVNTRNFLKGTDLQ